MADSPPSTGDGTDATTVQRLSRGERLFEAVDRRLPYLMLLPAFLLVMGLMLYPIVWAFKLSLYEVPIYNLDRQTYVGFENYVNIVNDPFTYDVLWNSFVFVGASIIGQVGIGVVLAIMLNENWLTDRATRFFRATYILPWATTGVIVAYSWQFLLNPRAGLVNQFLRELGMANPPAWVNSVEWAMVAIVIANIWRGTPFSLIFQTSGIQSIRNTFYEAAAVGGASKLQTVRHVTLPLLRPFIVMNLILVTLFTFNVFDIILVMTDGGPLDSTEVLALHMYETAFDQGQFGLASALSVVLFVINVSMVAFYIGVFGISQEATR